MPEFQYIALGAAGNRVTGLVKADTRREALRSLSAGDLVPVRLHETAAWGRGRPRVPARLLAALFGQLGELLSSGVPLLKALDIVAAQYSGGALKTVVEGLREEVAHGRSLHRAMRDRAEVFPDLVVSLVEAGEEGGFLEESLRRVATILENRDELRGRLFGALAYPAFLLLLGVLVFVGMMVFFVPRFEPLFSRLRANGTLPWPTVVLLSFSDMLRAAWWWSIPVSAGLAGVLHLLLGGAGRAVRRDRLRLSLPLLGPVFRDIALSRFCRVLGTLLANGVPMLRALGIAAGGAGNAALQVSIREASAHVTAGRSLTEPLRRCGMIPPETMETIAVGESSNRLDTVLVELSDRLDRRTQRRLESMVKLLEPALMVVLAALIGFLVVALLLPVFEGSSGVGR
jgi:general secretion pathway protein F